MSSEKPFEDEIAQLEAKLGVPTGLFLKLRDEDDWSFIIKTQALLETALSYIIQISLGREELAGFIDSLNLNGRTGKLAMVSALNLMRPEHIRYLERLSKLRNNLAHKIEYASFTLQGHLKSMNTGELNQFILDSFAIELGDEFKITDGVRDGVMQSPRAILWYGALYCLLEIYGKEKEAETESLKAQLYERFYKAYTPYFGRGTVPLKTLMMANAIRSYPGPGLLGEAVME